ncbi:MAG TPA: efflux transporter outer membrane subunit [Caulobacteraceae bacterium]|nr:efflux transporter outer membrane subunit [Caulobacteraceae bacterium]
MNEPYGHFWKRALAVGAAALAVAACATVPRMGPRSEVKPASSYAADRSLAAPAADWPADRWWEAYGDTQLSALIDEALRGSPTLAQARARLAAADAQARQARAATAPSLTFNGQADETELSREQGFPPIIQNYLPKGYQSYGRIALDASYDLDLFGRNRAALAAAVSQTQAVRADLAQSRLTLATAVAQAYGDLARLGAERVAAAATVTNRAETSRLVVARLRNGLDTRAELKQAEAATPASQADVEALDEQILIARHRISALLGEGPDRGLDIAMPTAGSVKAFGLPADLTVNLVGRRPDIVAARLRAEAAAKQIDAARAAFYPNITINAFVGQQALYISQLFNPAAAVGQFGPAVSLPIFDGGRLRGAWRGARANYDAAVGAYDQTLAEALQDVADSAVSVQSAARQLAERRQALEAGEAAYAVARLRFQGQLTSYVAVLSAEDAVIGERRALADAQARGFTLDIALVRALGGGFADTPKS